MVQRVDFIKHNLARNLVLVEENIKVKGDIKDLTSLYKEVLLNKSFNTKMIHVLDLLSIPSEMVLCLRNNSLDLYLEYYNYSQTMPDTNKVTVLIKEVVNQINTVVIALVSKIVTQDFSTEMSLEMMNDVLRLNLDPVLQIEGESVEDRNVLKRLNVILHQIEVFYSGADKNSQGANILNFLFRKLNSIVSNNADSSISAVVQKTIIYVINNYLVPFCKDYYFQGDTSSSEFLIKKDLLSGYLEAVSSHISSSCHGLVVLEELIVSKHLLNIQKMLQTNNTNIQRYISIKKDLKGLLSVDSNNKDKQLSFEVLILLHNNLVDVQEAIGRVLLTKTKDKHSLIKSVDSNIFVLFNMLQDFFEDNMYLMRYQELQPGIENFKSQLVNSTLLPFYQDLHMYLNLARLWENTERDNYVKQWSSFLSETI